MSNQETPIKVDRQATVLTIAGSDPSGGAGLQVDLKVFQQLKTYGMAVPTLLTVQNTQTVSRVETLSPELVDQQLAAVLDDIPPRAIKLGALGNADIARTIAKRLEGAEVPIVVDPVLVSKHGHRLADDETVEAYRDSIFPLATVVTPNRLEAELLSGVELSDLDRSVEVVERLHDFGIQTVLLKTGLFDDQRIHTVSHHDDPNVAEYQVNNLPNTNVHGSGCVLSACIAAALSLGVELDEALLLAIKRTFDAIGVGCSLGKGISPLETRAIQPIGVIDG